MKDLEQAGNFRGDIINFSLNEAKSGSVAVTVKVQIRDIFHEGEWHDWSEHGFVVHGDLWVVKKDGQINKSQAEALMSHAGWSGSFESITEGTWQPTPVSITVEPNEYNGVTSYRIAWVNAFENTPGGGGNIDATKAKGLDSKLGAQLRGLAGNQARNAKVPSVPPKTNPVPADLGKEDSRPDDSSVPF